jgi:hypothetical protein
MIKKNWFLLIFASVLAIGFVFAGSGGGDVHVMGLTGIMIDFPTNNYLYDFVIDYSNVTFTNSSYSRCQYILNGVPSLIFDCVKTFALSPQQGWNTLDVNITTQTGSESDYIAFFVDSLIPQIDITSPANGTQYGSLITQLNYDINEANLDSCWYAVDGGSAQSTTCMNGANSISLTSQEDWNTWTVCANDTVGHQNCSSVTFWVDSITPEIEFLPETTVSGNYSQNSIWATVEASDTNLQNIIINLYNSTGIVASQSDTISPLFKNFTGLGDGIYYLNATTQDTIGHTNQTETRTIMLDTTAPVVTLISPYNNQPFAFDQNVTFNFNVNEANPYACDLILNGNTNQTNFNNGDILSLPSGNQYAWNIQCTDSVGNSNTALESNTFTVLSNLTFPDGTDYTNLTNELNISSVYFWIRNGNGSIYWTDPIDMSRGAKWSDYITLEFNKASVDTTTTGAYEFKDKQADITFYNISWNSPQILRDGEICSSDICTELSVYIANVSYMFNVTSFSTY